MRAGVAATETDFAARAAAAEITDAMSDWRLLVVQFQTLDSLQHRCWDFLGLPVGRSSSFVEANQDEAGASSYGTRVDSSHVREARRAMRALDDAVGRLLELAARRGSALIAV